MHIKLIDVPLYYGCDNPGTHLAPMTFSKNQIASLIEERGHQLDRLSIVPTPQNPTDKDAEPTMKYLNEVTYTCRQLADCVHSGRHNGQFPLVIGGDHALGLGSIAGLARSIPADQLSVIWIDAHTDINTNLTSPSHNIHGMPLAAALGLGDSRLYENMGAQAPFLLPENLFYIGTRSVDPGEEEILAAHNIRIVRMPEIREKGIELCARELLDAVKTPYIHLSFDVDFLDAGEFWATGLPIPDGPSVEEAHQVIRTLFSDPRVCSADFVEYSPLHDTDGSGLSTCLSLLQEILDALPKE